MYESRQVPVSKLVQVMMPSMKELAQVPMPGVLANAIRQNAQQAEIAFSAWNHQMNERLKDYANLDENGVPKIVDASGERKPEYISEKHEQDYEAFWQEEFSKPISVYLRIVPSDLIEQLDNVRPAAVAGIQYMLRDTNVA